MTILLVQWCGQIKTCPMRRSVQSCSTLITGLQRDHVTGRDRSARSGGGQQSSGDRRGRRGDDSNPPCYWTRVSWAFLFGKGILAYTSLLDLVVGGHKGWGEDRKLGWKKWREVKASESFLIQSRNFPQVNYLLLTFQIFREVEKWKSWW